MGFRNVDVAPWKRRSRLQEEWPVVQIRPSRNPAFPSSPLSPNPKPKNPKPETLNPKPETRNPKP